MSRSDIYTTIDLTAAVAAQSSEFDMAETRAWVRSLRAAPDLRCALPQLIVKLEKLRRADMDPELRVGLLWLFKSSVCKAVRGLPKPGGPASVEEGGHSVPEVVSLEQRLILLMARNLHQALEALNRTHVTSAQRAARLERWVVTNLFGFMERQVRYGVCLRKRLPEYSWLEIHDAFCYLLSRGKASPSPSQGLTQANPRQDPTVLYLRLLLLGLLGELTEGVHPINLLYEDLWPMALDSYLSEPTGSIGEYGLYLIDASKNRPPVCEPGTLHDSFRGWVLHPSATFLARISRLNEPDGAV